MANNSTTLYNNLFSSLISDIKSYTGRDPLLPWLRGIRKMKDTISPHLLKEKLPRFLQKCSQTFLNDRRYANDLRYLRVWLQLMDYVDDPGAVLATMKANQIGMKKSLFYQACALYYEKMKRFEEAEKMYHLGVKNLAEPIDELQKSFDQFIHRMERHRNKKIERQGLRTSARPSCAGIKSLNRDDKENNENKGMPVRIPLKKSLSEAQPTAGSTENNVFIPKSSRIGTGSKESSHPGVASKLDPLEGHDGSEAEPQKILGDDTFVVNFVDTAIIGKSEAEDACHHGLVEPTINTKEAINAINSMFQEPLETARIGRRSHKSRPISHQSSENGFEVFIDDNLDNEVGPSEQKLEVKFLPPLHKSTESHRPNQDFQIFIDENSDMTERGYAKQNDKNRVHENKFQHRKAQILTEGAPVFSRKVSAFDDLPLDNSEDLNVGRPSQSKHREDTVVYCFVGSTISDEPQVENVCHHGLVEPTINLKEAMNDINSMFGKPIEFARKRRPKKQDKAPEKKDCGGFLILPDDDSEQRVGKSQPILSSRSETDLFEQTLCTKEAMEEINKMFGMPLDF